jgi:hypothetical protein
MKLILAALFLAFSAAPAFAFDPVIIASVSQAAFATALTVQQATAIAFVANAALPVGITFSWRKP